MIEKHESFPSPAQFFLGEILRYAERYVMISLRVEMHLGDDKAGTVDEVFYVNAVAVGKFLYRFIAV